MSVSTVETPRADATVAAGAPGRRARGTPVTILRIYVVALVLIPPSRIIKPLGAMGTPATVIGVGALLLWVLASLTPGRYLQRTVVPVRVVVGLLVTTIALGYAILHLRFVAPDELRGSDRMLLQVLSWAGVALLAAEGLRDRRELYRVLRTLVTAVAVMAAVGILQFRFGIDLVELVIDRLPGLHQNIDLTAIQGREGFRRPSGTATHPIEFGCVIAMTLPLALHLARFELTRPRLRRWVPVLVMAMGIPVAVSRSSVVGAVVATTVVIVGLDPKLRPRALTAVVGFVVAVYATSPGLLGALRNLFLTAGSDSSITARTSDYDKVAEYISQAPWFGRGPGTFLPAKYIFLDNQYLLSAIEIGLIGLVVVVVYLFTTACFGRGARHRSADAGVRDLGQAMAAWSVASAVSAFTFDGFSFLMFAGLVPLGVGLAGALWATVQHETLSLAAGSLGADGNGDGSPPLTDAADPPTAGLADTDHRALEDGPPAAAALMEVAHGARGAALAADEPGPGDGFHWLTSFDESASGIRYGARNGLPSRRPTGRQGEPGEVWDDGPAGAKSGRVRGQSTDSRQAAAGISAVLFVAILGGVALTVSRSGENKPDLSAVSRPAATAGSIGDPSTTLGSIFVGTDPPSTATTTQPPAGTTVTRQGRAPTVPPSGRTTAATGSGATSAPSASSAPTSSVTSGPTPTTTPATVPPRTTTPPTTAPTTTTAPPTTAPTTTTTAPTTTTTPTSP